jgi:cobalt transporter subunit CbtA
VRFFSISPASRKSRIFTTALTIPGTPPDFPAIDGVTALFNRIACAAGLAGLVSGLFLTGLQQLQIAPLILDAERYEAAATQTSSASHQHAASGSGDEAAAPRTGLRRTLDTALANIVVAIGFALLLASAMSLRASASGWRAGIAWGAAGYAVFFVSPALGLPPRLPGADAAPLLARELWWGLTVTSTAAGLWLAALQRNRALRLLGVLLLIAPHAIGAPQPLIIARSIPADLERQFILATFFANAAFWLALGTSTGYFLGTRRRDPAPAD